MLEQAMRNNYDMYDLPARKLRTKQSVLKEMLDENNEKNTDSAEIDRSK